eukprot:TRINITY_DN5240_c1_g1_i1.p1 TRINITY_DN5240_c1_g1~~TRINITY_DN5240_c1_g1_i1.p1  ORF type:complete len:243 (-),score=-13.73 TRINITY_DN5240_c1_g1_i1:291-1019(-)
MDQTIFFRIDKYSFRNCSKIRFNKENQYVYAQNLQSYDQLYLQRNYQLFTQNKLKKQNQHITQAIRNTKTKSAKTYLFVVQNKTFSQFILLLQLSPRKQKIGDKINLKNILQFNFKKQTPHQKKISYMITSMMNGVDMNGIIIHAYIHTYACIMNIYIHIHACTQQMYFEKMEQQNNLTSIFTHQQYEFIQILLNSHNRRVKKSLVYSQSQQLFLKVKQIIIPLEISNFIFSNQIQKKPLEI